MQFTRHHKQLVAPFVIYANFESDLKEFQEKKKKRNDTNKSQYYTTSKYWKWKCQSENEIYNVICKILEKVPYCKTLLKKHLKRENIERKKKNFFNRQ